MNAHAYLNRIQLDNVRVLELLEDGDFVEQADGELFVQATTVNRLDGHPLAGVLIQHTDPDARYIVGGKVYGCKRSLADFPLNRVARDRVLPRMRHCLGETKRL